MTDLPEFGQKVKIWPAPDRVRIQESHRTLDESGGGRALAAEGREVAWSAFHLEQLRAGDIVLHSPVPTATAAPAKE